ncbi:GNAT family N-acetyltransferase [Bacillus toyonensis]|uniref:GNAT family N-acetyltransferase n=1 Tax=Bacillus toyonensis TaxID=155322 RepID=UPI003D303792
MGICASNKYLRKPKGKGYRSMLMDKIMEIAKANGINKIVLDYWFNNEIARNFYKKNDFVKNREFVYKDI